MKVQNLNNIDFEILMNCFLKAFENYFVKMPTNLNYYKERWKTAKVDFKLSYGMFDKGKLIGFIINAIDKRNDTMVAFNTGTGVLPAYRGKRIVKSIYKDALPDLKRHGITKCTLEVIKENSIAIKSYQSIGFKIIKNYKCYKGNIAFKSGEKVTLKRVDYNQLDWQTLPNQELYSWDNHSRILKNGKYQYFQVLKGKSPESYFVINPTNGYLAQFDLLENKNTNWERLFSGIKSICKTIKINNIDQRLEHKINYLDSIGLMNTVDQYEMELILNNN